MTHIGIDPGSRWYGVAVFRDGRFVRAYRGALKGDLPTRLAALRDDIESLIAEEQPYMVAIEDSYCGQSRKSYFVAGSVYGVIAACAVREGARVIKVAPSEAKAAVGGGRLTKKGVAEAVSRLCSLQASEIEGEIADAIAVAWATVVKGRLIDHRQKEKSIKEER